MISVEDSKEDPLEDIKEVSDFKDEYDNYIVCFGLQGEILKYYQDTAKEDAVEAYVLEK